MCRFANELFDEILMRWLKLLDGELGGSVGRFGGGKVRGCREVGEDWDSECFMLL